MKNKNKKLYPISGLILASIFVLLPLKTSASDITSENVISEINSIRVTNGLKPLKTDPALSNAATLKSNNMIDRGYFDHYAYGLTPWMLITNSGYDYQYAGENLAMDFNTTEGMVNAWMNSPAHRQNILNKNFQDIGVGVVKGVFTTASGQSHKTTMVTQMFGKKKSPILSVTSKFLYRLFGIY
jgi:uncharacterized protein YkwD